LCRGVFKGYLEYTLEGFGGGMCGGNVLQLPEGGDFEALHCQPSTNFDRSTIPKAFGMI